MNPFSPFYYLRENKARAAALVFVMSLSMLTYLIGLYTSNPYVDNLKNIEFYKDFTVIAADENEESKKQLCELLENNSFEIEGIGLMDVDYYSDSGMVGKLLNVNYFLGIYWNTLMDFRGGVTYPVFHDSEQFREFTDVLGLPYNGEDKVIIMGNKLAKNFDFEIGDTVNNDQKFIFGFKNGLTLVATYDESDYGVSGEYSYFRVDSAFKPLGGDQPNAVLLLRKKGDASEINTNRAEFIRTVESIKARYDKLIYLDYKYNLKYVEDVFMAYWPIFMVPLIMIGAVLVLTSVGIFSVALEKREFEFSVYKAIGFSRSRVLLKGIAEVLILNILSIVLGVIFILITVASVNDMLLHRRGLELQYYSELAITSYILCNLAIFVPLAAMQVYKILKSNVVG